MCSRCADIDYPIGDSIWLPCGGDAGRYRAKPQRVVANEEYFSNVQIFEVLRQQLRASEHRNRRLVEENELLKSRRPMVVNAMEFEPVQEPHD